MPSPFGYFLGLRYNSPHVRTAATIVGIVSGLPWLILGMLSLGSLFYHLSLKSISLPTAVALGVGLIAIRQIWTVRLGMRGVIISDMIQGIVAYGLGTLLLVLLIAWLVLDQGKSFAQLSDLKLTLPDRNSQEGGLFLFSLIATGTIGGWCWPAIFVRMFTANSVRSLKMSAALAAPVSLIFGAALLIFAMLASTISSVAANPNDVWFIVSLEAGGHWTLGLAGAVFLAASMGNIDGHIQATGAQIANDLIGTHWKLDEGGHIIVAKIGMAVLTVLSAWLACLDLPSLSYIAILSFQGIIQLAVPQFLGVFWRRGNAQGALAGMVVGFATVLLIEFAAPQVMTQAQGLTSGMLALLLNLAIYLSFAYLWPMTAVEKRRVDALFEEIKTGAEK